MQTNIWSEKEYAGTQTIPEFNQQEEDTDSSGESSPLGLTLRKTPSFLSLLQRTLSSKGKQTQGTKMDADLGSQSISERLKASNFSAGLIKIGAWQRITKHEGDLTAKLYYAKRKLVWEVLDGALKSKIEIQWCDIIGIRAIMPHKQPGILEIELNQPPSFYREMNPQPRKHTIWQQASDFTGGQAPVWRRHYVRFPPGVLDKHYEKLLQCDERLLALSHKPFPSNESPYFDPTMFGLTELSLSFNGYRSGYLPGVQYPYHTYPTTPNQAPALTLLPNSTMTVMDMGFGNEGGSSNQFVSDTQMQMSWGQGPSNISPEPQDNQVLYSNISPATQEDQVFYLNINPATQEDQVFYSNIIPATQEDQVFYSNISPATQEDQVFYSNSIPATHEEQVFYTNISPATQDNQFLYSNVGVLNDIQNHLLGDQSQVLSSDDLNPNCSAFHSGVNYEANDSINDQMMQDATRNIYPISSYGLYPEHVNWLSPQDSNDTIVMNNSLPDPPFMYPANPTNTDFF